MFLVNLPFECRALVPAWKMGVVLRGWWFRRQQCRRERHMLSHLEAVGSYLLADVGLQEVSHATGAPDHDPLMRYLP